MSGRGFCTAYGGNIRGFDGLNNAKTAQECAVLFNLSETGN